MTRRIIETRSHWLRTILVANLLLWVVAGNVAIAESKIFRIEAQPVAAALRAFGQQAGAQLLYRHEVVDGHVCHAVFGTYEPAVAIRLLLEGTGLHAAEQPGDVFVIEPDSKALSDPPPVPTARLIETVQGPAAGGAVLADSVGRTPPASESEAASGKTGLEEIIVTAQKRSENVQKIPVAITVLSGETLSRRAVYDATGLTSMVPNVQVVQDSSGTTVEIRGIYNTFSGSQVDQSVTFNVDGVYYPRTISQSGTFFDLDRIEVLRGPQGTLLGRGAAAGAVNVIPNRPTGRTETQVAMETGNYGLLSTSGVANVAVSDAVGIRAAFQTLHHDGYISGGFNDADAVAGRVQASFEVSDAVNLRLFGSYFHGGGRGDVDVALPLARHPWQNSLYYLSNLSFQDDRIWDVHAQLDWNLGIGTLTYVPAAVETDCNCDYLNFGLVVGTRQYSRQYTQELRLASKDDGTPSRGNVKWIAGLYWLKENQTESQIVQTATDLDHTIPNTFPPLTPLEHLNYDPIVSKSYAAFGQATYFITDRSRLTAGLRYTKDEKSQNGTALVLIAPPPFNGPFADSGSQSFHNTSYRVALEGDVADNSLLYATVSTGYKPGGFFDGTSPGNSYRPEHLTSFEVGSKNRFLGNRLQMNADGFWYNYKDFQITELGPTNNGELTGTIILNAGQARIYGIESENSLLVTDSDRIDLTAAWTVARYTHFVVDPGFGVDISNGSGQIQTDFSNTDMPMVPKWSANVGYQHEWGLPNGATLTGHLESHVSSGYWGFFAQIRDTHQAGYTRSEIQLVYSPAGAKWDVEAYVKNLEDKAQLTQASVGPTIVPATAAVTAPRLFGVRFQVKL